MITSGAGKIMQEFKSSSQAGQDMFAYIACGMKPDGTFIDIGMGHPTERNNTWALEQIGWSGIMIDASDELGALAHLRSSRFIHGNAVDMDWSLVLKTNFTDYLSLDVDESSLSALNKFPLSSHRFRAITIEHDLYRFGTGPKVEMINILGLYGYSLVSENVTDEGLPFEDWWVDMDLVDQGVISKFISKGRDGKELSNEVAKQLL